MKQRPGSAILDGPCFLNATSEHAPVRPLNLPAVPFMAPNRTIDPKTRTATPAIDSGLWHCACRICPSSKSKLARLMPIPGPT
jgi:hypothetical protein